MKGDQYEMPSKMRIGVGPYAGDYELDIEGELLTKIEWRWIKQIAEYFPMTISDGLNRGDPDLFAALAVIALYRNGRIQKHEALQVAESFDDLPFDGQTLTLIGGDEEGDPTQASPTPLETDSDKKTNDSTALSGNGSSESSVSPESDPSPTGDPISETPISVLDFGRNH